MKNQTGLYVLDRDCAGCGKRAPLLWSPTTLIPTLTYCRDCLRETSEYLATHEMIFKNAQK